MKGIITMKNLYALMFTLITVLILVGCDEKIYYPVLELDECEVIEVIVPVEVLKEVEVIVEMPVLVPVRLLEEENVIGDVRLVLTIPNIQEIGKPIIATLTFEYLGDTAIDVASAHILSDFLLESIESDYVLYEIELLVAVPHTLIPNDVRTYDINMEGLFYQEEGELIPGKYILSGGVSYHIIETGENVRERISIEFDMVNTYNGE